MLEDGCFHGGEGSRSFEAKKGSQNYFFLSTKTFSTYQQKLLDEVQKLFDILQKLLDKLQKNLFVELQNAKYAVRITIFIFCPTKFRG